LKAAMNNIKRQEESLEDEINTTAGGLLQTATTLHAVTSTLKHVRIMSDCRAKLIPMFVVHPNSFRADLKRLQTALSFKHKTLAIPPERFYEYFSLPLATCLISPERIIVTIRFPIVQVSNKYGLVQIKPLPFAYNKTVCHIDVPSEFVTKINSTYIPRSLTQEGQCDPRTSHLCLVQLYSQLSYPIAPCIQSILTGQPTVDELKAMCPLICHTYSRTATIVHQSPPTPS